MNPRHWPRFLARSVGLVAGIGGVAASSLPGRIWCYDATLTGPERRDAAIVLGAATRGDEPSPVFEGRLAYAVQLFAEGRVTYVIVSGGTRDPRQLSEAEVGRRYLVRCGVPSERVLLESEARSTHENLRFSARIGSAYRLSSYAIVSDPWHLYRATRLAEHMGLDAVPAGTPHTRYRSLASKAVFVLRESFFCLKLWLLPLDF